MGTEIKKDELGLYVIAGGWIARPFYGTCFNEGDTVKSHHFGGSTRAGVTLADRKETHNFKRNGVYEIWCTTGISSWEYRSGKYTQEEIKETTEWYRNHNQVFAPAFKKVNEEFLERL
jgi:hypothetical protein